MSVHEERRRPEATGTREQRLVEAIRSIAVALEEEDPAFARRMRGERERRPGTAAAVVVLLVASALLLATGLAIGSPWAWFAGAAAFLATFALDPRTRRPRPHPGRS